jgi:hypothetical protein
MLCRESAECSVLCREGLKQKNNKILLLSTAAHVYQTETNQAGVSLQQSPGQKYPWISNLIEEQLMTLTNFEEEKN